MTNSETLRLMRLIQCGCKKHPEYKANRKPRPACHDCADMWKARLRLAERA